MTVSVDKINALLGIKVPAEKMKEILENLNFGVKLSGDKMSLEVPAYREDIDLYPDIAEEIIRFYGYDNIEGTFLPTAAVTNGGYTAGQKAENAMKTALVGKGLYEISSYSFYSEKDLNLLRFPQDAEERKAIKILNPISEELSVMRTTLAPSMLGVIVRNMRRGNAEGKLFEIAKVYIPKELPLKDFPEEKSRLCIGVWGKYDFFDLKGICEEVAEVFNIKFYYEAGEKPFLHPGITAKIICGGECVGYAGMLSPEISDELALDRAVHICEIDYDKIARLSKPFKYVPVSKFAEQVRDLALVCDAKLSCGQIEKEIYAACKFVTDVKLFDVYMGEQVGKGKKSMAYKITFTPKDEPIENKIDGFVKKILGSLNFKLGIELR